MASRELRVEIIGDASSLQRALGKATGSSNRFGSSLKTLGRVAAVGVGAAFAGMAVTLKVGFDEMAEGQRVAAQTGAVLKSTGSSANVTAKQVDSLAQSLSQMSGVDDEAIQSGENLLLTFTKIRNEVGAGNDIFNQATEATLNLSVAMGKDMTSSAILVGKALNDPVKGMTALTRAGIQFTEEQKKTIGALVESGDVMGAQKIILEELTTQFGGSAKAAGETFPGQLAKLRNAFEEAAGEITKTLLPHLQRFLDFVLVNMPTIQRTIQTMVDVVVFAFETLAAAIDIVRGPITDFKGFLEDNPGKAKILAGAVLGLAAALTTATVAQLALNAAILLNPYVAAIAGIGLLVGALAALYITNQRVHDAINENLVKLRTITQQTLAVVTAIWQRFGASITAIASATFGTVTLAFRNMLDVMRGIVNIFAGVFTGDWRRVWTGVKQIFDGMIGNLLGVVRGWVSALGTLARQAGVAIVQGVVAGLARLVPAVSSKLLEVRGALISAAAQAAGWAVGIGQAIVNGILSGVGGLFGALKAKLEGTLRSVLTSLNPFSSVEEGGAKHIGFPLAEGTIRGWVEGSVALPAKMSETLRAAVEKAAASVAGAKDAFSAAFSELTSGALAVFDRFTSDFETRTERLIRRQDEARARAERQSALTEAQAGLATAQASGDPEAIKQAEQELADAMFAIQRAADEKRAAQERADYEQRRERQRHHLEQRLQALQQSFLQGEITVQQFTQRLNALLQKAEIPTRLAARRLGFSLAAGFNEARGEVLHAARALAHELQNVLGNISVAVKVHVSRTDAPDSERRQHGGPVRAGHSYIVGEAGPELFVPRASGHIVANAAAGSGRAVGGGPPIIFNFHGTVVGTDRHFEDAVRRALYDVGRRNPGIGFSTT